MRSREQNFLAMAHTVNTVVQNNQPKWVNVVRFAQCAQELNDLVSLIVDVNAAADSNITGATQDKASICLRAADEGLKLAKRTSVYASDKKNLELRQRLTISRSELLDQHGAEILATLRDWIARINPVISELEPYGILPADLHHFKGLVDEYDNLLTRPRELVVARKTMNQSSLPDLLAKTREVLEHMDNLINLFEATPFEAQYRNARMIIDLGSRSAKPENSTPPDGQQQPPAPEDTPELPAA